MIFFQKKAKDFFLSKLILEATLLIYKPLPHCKYSIGFLKIIKNRFIQFSLLKIGFWKIEFSLQNI